MTSGLSKLCTGRPAQAARGGCCRRPFPVNPRSSGAERSGWRLAFSTPCLWGLSPTTSEQLIDATFIEVKSPLPQRGWTKIGNGLKILALCAPDGAFSAISCGSAGPGEARLAATLFERVSPPQLLLADAAYDTRRLREQLSERDCRLLTTRPWPSRKIPLNTPTEVEYVRARRWPIERSFAWLKAYAGIAVCRARSLAAFGVALALAIATINSRM